MEGVEQLYYRWAERGWEGASKFQVVARTPGLDRASDKRRRVISHLCYFPTVGQSSDDQYSFGWIDVGGLRYAFQKTTLGEGRSGNFAAHFLIADTAQLPVRWLIPTFLGEGWWTGDDRFDPTLELRLVEPKSTHPLPAVDRSGATRDASAALLGLAAKDRVTHIADSGSWRAALLHLLEYDSQSLDKISFSSLEGAKSSGRFDVAGVVRRTPTTPLRPEWLSAAEFLLGPGLDRVREINSSVKQSQAWRSEKPFTSLTSVASRLMTLKHADRLTSTDLARLLDDPSLAQTAMESSAARGRLAESLVRDRSLIRPLEAALPHLTPDVQHELARVAVEAQPTSGDDLPNLLRVFSPYPAAVEGAVYTFKLRGVSSYTGLRSWPPEVCVALIALQAPDSIASQQLSDLAWPLAEHELPLLVAQEDHPIWHLYFCHQAPPAPATRFREHVLRSGSVARAAARVAPDELLARGIQTATFADGISLVESLASVDPIRIRPILKASVPGGEVWRWVAELARRHVPPIAYESILIAALNQRAAREALNPSSVPRLREFLASTRSTSRIVNDWAELDEWIRHSGSGDLVPDLVPDLSQIKSEYGENAFLYCLSGLLSNGTLSAQNLRGIALLVENQVGGGLMARTALASALRSREFLDFTTALRLTVELGRLGHLPHSGLGRGVSDDLAGLLDRLIQLHGADPRFREFAVQHSGRVTTEGRIYRKLLRP